MALPPLPRDRQAPAGDPPDTLLPDQLLADQFLVDLAAAAVPHDLPPLLAALDRWVQQTLDCSAEDCRADWDDLHATALATVFDTVSRFNQALTVRLIDQAVQDLQEDQHRSPPLPFCWITLGSDARGEQVIRTDQDNALIYADPVPGTEQAAAAYFGDLAGRVTRELDRLGFAFCPGEVMASNPRWCRSLSQWLEALETWVGSSDPMAVRHLTILLDFRAVFGDRRLAAMLQSKVFSSFNTHPAASHFLVRDDQLFAPPKTLFKRIRTRREKGCRACFNLKTQAIAHIVNGARLFAVNQCIQTPSTLQRLARLADETVIAKDEHRDLRSAFVFLTRLKIRQHLGRTAGTADGPPANHIDVAALNRGERQALNRALDMVARFQKKMAAAYNQNWMNFFN